MNPNYVINVYPFFHLTTAKNFQLQQECLITNFLRIDIYIWEQYLNIY